MSQHALGVPLPSTDTDVPTDAASHNDHSTVHEQTRTAAIGECSGDAGLTDTLHGAAASWNEDANGPRPEVRERAREYESPCDELPIGILDAYEHLAAGAAVIKDQQAELQLRTAQLEEANRQLSELAITDGLTGLTNYRTFQERLGLEVERSARYNVPFGVATLSPAVRDPSELIAMADTALYASKERGRNRVTHADRVESPPAGA